MKHRVVVTAVVSACAVLLAGGAAWAQLQSKDKQKCINKMNKDGIKVQAKQGKENTECVKRKNNNELPGATDAEICLEADAKGKVGKKTGKTLADEIKFCAGDGVPDFGYTSAANVNLVAQQAELDLIHDIFGAAPIDDGLFERDPNVFEAVCQRNVVKRVEKLIQTMGREFVKCKKNALKTKKDPFPFGADEAADLEDCVDNPGALNSVAADTKGKIAKRGQKLLDTIMKQCEPSGVSATSFPGDCDALAGSNLRDCLLDLAECRFCLMVNAMDGLSVPCAAFSGIACP